MPNGGRQFSNLGVSSIFARMGSKDPDLPKLGVGDAQPVVVVADLSPSLGVIPFEPRGVVGTVVQGGIPPFYFVLLAVAQPIVIDSITLTVQAAPGAVEMTWAISRTPIFPAAWNSVLTPGVVQLGGARATAAPDVGLSDGISPTPFLAVSSGSTLQARLADLAWFIPSSLRLAVISAAGTAGADQTFSVEVSWRELEQAVGST